MVTPTWQSSGSGPNFMASNALAISAGNTVVGGIDRLAKSAKGFADKQKANTFAGFQNDLLGMSLNPDLNENKFLGQAIRLGKEQGLDPAQSLKAVAATNQVREQIVGMKGPQQQEFNLLKQQLVDAKSQGEADNALTLADWDLENPGLQTYQRTMQDFKEGNGIVGAIDAAVAGIPEFDNIGKVRQKFLDFQNDNPGKYADEVLARTIKEVGVEHDEADLISLWMTDTISSVNENAFTARLKRNQKEYEKGMELNSLRSKKESELGQALIESLSAANKRVLSYQDITRKQNMRDFTSQ